MSYQKIEMSTLNGKTIQDVDTSVSHNLKITFTDGTTIEVVTQNSDPSVVWEGPNQ